MDEERNYLSFILKDAFDVEISGDICQIVSWETDEWEPLYIML